MTGTTFNSSPRYVSPTAGSVGNKGGLSPATPTSGSPDVLRQKARFLGISIRKRQSKGA